MDPNGNIYEAPEDEIPAEDKARLDGYLKARAEADARAQLEALAAKLNRLEAEADD